MRCARLALPDRPPCAGGGARYASSAPSAPVRAATPSADHRGKRYWMRMVPWQVTRRDSAIIAWAGSPVATRDVVDIRSAIDDAGANDCSTAGRGPANPARHAGGVSRVRRIRRSPVCIRHGTELLREWQIFIGKEATNAGSCRQR